MGNLRYKKYKATYEIYRIKNRDKIKDINKSYYLNNLEKFKNNGQKFRDKKFFGGMREYHKDIKHSYGFTECEK